MDPSRRIPVHKIGGARVANGGKSASWLVNAVVLFLIAATAKKPFVPCALIFRHRIDGKEIRLLQIR